MKYLTLFSANPETDPFRGEELRSVCEAVGCTLRQFSQLAFRDAADCSSPLFLVDIDEEFIVAVANRCVLLKTVFQPIVHAASVEACVDAVSDLPEDATDAFRCSVECFGKHYDDETCRDIIMRVVTGHHRGRIELKNPEVEYAVVVVFNGKKECEHALYVKHVCSSQRKPMLDIYSLKKRPYIGTTSMPPELTFLMANMARIRADDVVLDPFCGTCSTLVSCAHFHAFCFGCDMDGRVMRSGTAADIKRKSEARAAMLMESESISSVETNFEKYRLCMSWPERLRLNFSLAQKSFRAGSFFDAIVTDPPYGLREQKRKVSSSDSAVSGYEISDLATDLVSFAARTLRVGGRLVFWLPTTKDYSREELPLHPVLRLVSDPGQQVSIKLIRRLVTMEKVRETTATDTVARPLRNTQEARERLDMIEIPSDEAYCSYRHKIDSRRKAASDYMAAQGLEDRPRPCRSEIARKNIENRARNVAECKKKDRVSSLRNRRSLTPLEHWELFLLIYACSNVRIMPIDRPL